MKMHPADRRTLRQTIIMALALASSYFIQYYLLGNGIGNEIAEQPYYYCCLIWVSFAILSAKFEAYYYAHEIVSKLVDNFNEHPLFVLIRLHLFIPLWIITDWKAALCYFFMFPFFHDGSYYTQRERIKEGTYPKKWYAQSTTSTALSTKFMTPVVRTALAVVSIVALVILRYAQ